MNIRNLIDLLAQFEHDSEFGEDTEVVVNVHMGNGYAHYIEKPVHDAEIEFGPGPDTVKIQISLYDKDLADLHHLSEIMAKEQLEP